MVVIFVGGRVDDVVLVVRGKNDNDDLILALLLLLVVIFDGCFGGRDEGCATAVVGDEEECPPSLLPLLLGSWE